MNDLVADKKKYIKPITESFPMMIMEDFIANTPENNNSYTDSNQDDWENPNVPDDEIPW